MGYGLSQCRPASRGARSENAWDMDVSRCRPSRRGAPRRKALWNLRSRPARPLVLPELSTQASQEDALLADAVSGLSRCAGSLFHGRIGARISEDQFSSECVEQCCCRVRNHGSRKSARTIHPDKSRRSTADFRSFADAAICCSWPGFMRRRVAICSSRRWKSHRCRPGCRPCHRRSRSGGDAGKASAHGRAGEALRAESTGPGFIDGDLKWGALRACEAFVLSSHSENFGIAVVEALAVGPTGADQ